MQNEKKDNIFQRIFGNIFTRRQIISSSSQFDKDFYLLQNYTQFLSSFFTRNILSSKNFYYKRINLYDYDYLMSRLPEVSKQVKVIISYILKPDILENEPIVFDSQQNTLLTKLAEKFFQFIEIKKYLKQILYDFLVYGDAYVKVDYLKVKSNRENITLEEVLKIYDKQLQLKPIYEHKSLEIVLKEQKKILLEQTQPKRVIMENIEPVLDDTVETTEHGDSFYLPYKISVISPHNVIKLQEYGINGYLVLPNKLVETNYIFSNIDDKYRNLLFGQELDTQSISKKFQDYIKQSAPELENQIQSLIINETDEIIFYPSSSGVIFNFCNFEDPSLYPYGTSILKEQRELQFFVFLIEMQLLVYKINRQTSRRIIQIPIDNVPPEEIPEYIETIKQKLKNDITIDLQNGDLRTIPQILSILDDYFIPVENGTPMFTIELLQGDSSQQEQFQNELDYFNKKIITSLHIPYQYVLSDSERQTNTRLLQEDEHFARLVDEYQQLIEVTLNEMLQNFLYKINREVFYEPIVKLQRPVQFNKLLYYEIQNQKIEYQSKLKDLIPNLPIEYILTEILDMSPTEVDKIKDQIEKSKYSNLESNEY